MFKSVVLCAAVIALYFCAVCVGLWDTPFSSIALAGRMWISFTGVSLGVISWLLCEAWYV